MRGLHCLDGYGVLLVPGGRRQRPGRDRPGRRERRLHVLRIKRDHAIGQGEATVGRLVGSETETTVIAN